MSRDPAAVRQAALLAVVFGATLLTLLGLTAVVGRSGAPSAATSPLTTGSAAPATFLPVAVAPTTAPPTSSPSADPSATPTAASDPVLVGAGDIADCATEDDEATAALLDDIEGTVFTAGDNVYESASAATFRDCYERSWGRHKDRTRPAAGNHDWQDGGIGAYREYFGAAAGAGTATWYAYDLGTWRVIVLDSNCESVDGCDASSPQGRWLAADLAATKATCTVAIWHHPRFSSGEHGDQSQVAPFWDALYAAGADVIVNGHDHDYERFAPMDPDGREDRERGLRQFVAGTGGRALRGFGDVAPHSELRASVAHGVLALTLRDGSYDWQFIPTAGAFADRGTARCH